MTAAPTRRGESNADVMFNYVVRPTDTRGLWFETAAKCTAWIKTHRTEHGVHVVAHHAGDAVVRARAAGQRAA